ncbi:hypothetical protein J6590_060599 [Homalodisca vitripennis]|nr:hypothetical protein J6590_060599 [Homalodisca vitripennis]
MVVGDKSCGSGITEKGNKQADNTKECQLLLEKKVNTEDFITAVEGHPSIWDVPFDSIPSDNSWSPVVTRLVTGQSHRSVTKRW